VDIELERVTDGEQEKPGKGWTPELQGALLAAVVASAIGVWVLQLWRAHLDVPFVLGRDATLNLVMVKDVIQHGWYLTNPNLAAPFGQELYDFPAVSGDSLYLVIIKALGIVSHDPAVVMNSFFLLCFPLIAISAFVVLRRLGVSIGAATLSAILFTVLPARFDNGELHIFVGAYFLVPVCCYLVLALFEGRELFARNPQRQGLYAYATWRSAAVVGVCLAVGSSDSYFALFTVALMGLAAVLRFLATRGRRALLCGLAATAVILGAVALNGLPSIIYTAQHGRDTAVGHRFPQETDTYGLSLANLVLPIEGDRIPALAHLTKRYLSTELAPVPGETSFDSLGIIGVFGLLWLWVSLGARCLGSRGAMSADPRAMYAALGAGIAFLIGTVGGLGTLFAYIVNPQLRATNRIAIFIAFFALYGFALAVDRLRLRLNGSHGRRTFAAVLVILLAIGTLDQTSPRMVPSYKPSAAQYHSDAEFVQAIERQLPSGASVFQLPYVSFPEAPPIGGMEDYDEFIGYLHSNNLRWSYGAMRGRPADWESVAVREPVERMLAEVSAIGFQGIYLDSFGLVEHGAKLIPALSQTLGVQPLISPNRRLYFFNLALYNERLRQRYSEAQLTQLANSALYPATG
jgi:Dolichyl-phosphate-mannose-protein mannosyltransferase